MDKEAISKYGSPILFAKLEHLEDVRDRIFDIRFGMRSIGKSAFGDVYNKLQNLENEIKVQEIKLTEKLIKEAESKKQQADG